MTRRPVCVKCKTEFVPERNGIGLLEKSSIGMEYAVWEADLYKCQSCGTEIIVGFGLKGIEHWEENFAKARDFHKEHEDLYVMEYRD